MSLSSARILPEKFFGIKSLFDMLMFERIRGVESQVNFLLDRSAAPNVVDDKDFTAYRSSPGKRKWNLKKLPNPCSTKESWLMMELNKN